MHKNDNRKPTFLSRIVWRILSGLYSWKGWNFEGEVPPVPKYILIGAPHTSNWDFVVFAGVVRRKGIRPRFMGKHTLFKWPMTRFMYDMGGMPVDRSKAGGYVRNVIAEIDAADEIALVVAPEGSRKSDGHWRSGFYHIAMGAGIPLVPAWVNHDTMQGGFGDPIMPSGDFLADLAKLAAFYRTKRPDCARFDTLMAQAAGEVANPAKR